MARTRIEPISPDEPQAMRLINQSDALLSSLYPSESNHLEGVEALMKSNVLFVGAYRDGDLAGCGAVKIQTDHGTYDTH